jgi:ribose-phosphate pyrophosphokinase
MAMYNKFAENRTDCDVNFAMMSKRRDKPNSIESMELIGDVNGRNVILVDDMTDTAGTLLRGAEILKSKGAKSVTAIISHAVLSGDSPRRVYENDFLDRLVVSDSLYDVTGKAQTYPEKIQVMPCTLAFSRAIAAVINGESIEAAIS